MKKYLLLFLGITGALLIQAQSLNSKTKKTKKEPTVISKPIKLEKDWSKIDLSTRPADHFMLQYGADIWTGRPDSVRTNGFSRHFNFYFMFDKPFKTNPHYSLGIGIGLGSSNMFFNGSYVNLKSTSTTLPFSVLDSTDNFKKFKLTSMTAEIPVEIRYFSDPENPGKSWKAAAGIKVGTLLKAYTKGKNYVNKSGVSYYGSTYVQKESDRRFMNGTVLELTGRLGYGIYSINGGYNIIGVLKDGTGPVMNKISIGLTISGL